MQIGTPLSKNATKVMLLGSGELGKEVIIALQRFGVEVIAVDRYENAPGHQVAHRSYVIDMADPEALRDLIGKEKPQIIVPEIEAIATEILIEIEEHGLAEVIPTARAVHLSMNREGIRILAAEQLKLPTSKFAFSNNIEEIHSAINNGIGYPCFIKPVVSSSGKGQSLVYKPEEITTAWEHAMQGGRINRGKVIVEEKINFDYEITLLTVRALDSKGEINTYFCDPVGHIQERGDYIESWQPQHMSTQALQKAQEIAKQITGNLGGRGIFGVELFVKGDDVWFSEVSPRPHDTGMVTMITQQFSEFELHARAILGLPVSVTIKSPGASAVIYGGLNEKAISFSGLDEALFDPQCDLRLFGKPISYEHRRMGVVLVYSDTVEDARRRAKLAAGKIKPFKDPV